MSTAGAKPQYVTFTKQYAAKLNAAIVKGVGVYISAASEVDVAVGNSKVMGVAQETVTGDGATKTEIALLCGGGTLRVKCSATATRGEYAIAGTGGFENQTIGGGTTVKYLAGQFLESGVAGDFVEMAVGAFAAGCA